jgi:hypothetical protein
VLYFSTEKIAGFILTFPSLMAGFRKQFAVLMFSHLFPSLFNDAAQLITSSLVFL